MAAGNNSNAIYYSIANGKICRQVKSESAHSVTRVNKNGKTVHEEFYDFLDGVITDIQTKDNEFGKFWMITLQDIDSTQILQMNYSSGYSAAFLKMLPNVDLNSKVKITPKITMEGEKKKTSLFINQHGIAIKWFFTKDDPAGLPPLQQKKVKGKVVWDDSDTMEFLEKMVNEKIKPFLKGSKVAVSAQEAEPEPKMPF